MEIPKYLQMSLEYLNPKLKAKVLKEYIKYKNNSELDMFDEVGGWDDNDFFDKE